MDFDKFNFVVLKLSKKYRAKNDYQDDYAWVEKITDEEIEMLRSIKNEILDRMQSINFRYSGNWFYYVCRKILRDERLKNAIFDEK